MAGDPPNYQLPFGYLWPPHDRFEVARRRVMPVNLPVPSFGVTVVYMDGEGNTIIKVDQPKPDDIKF